MSSSDKSKDCVKKFAKLRQMREDLCKKEKTWSEAFAARDWIVSQIKMLHEMSIDSLITKTQMKEQIADILCALEPQRQSKDKIDG